MRSSVFLRIASVLMLLYCAGHTSGYPWTPVLGELEMTTVQSMKSNPFDVMGSMRTYWDFYLGFGFGLSVLMLALAVSFWQLSSLARRNVAGLRPVVLTFFVALTIVSIVNIHYFFLIPMLMSVVISICLGVAFVYLPRKK